MTINSQTSAIVKLDLSFKALICSRATAITNVELPLRYSGKPDGRRERAIEALKAVGLEDRIHIALMNFLVVSSNELQIARAIVNNPAIIMADEPTGNLDSKVGKEIMSLLNFK